jgi:hypothetical protein
MLPVDSPPAPASPPWWPAIAVGLLLASALTIPQAAFVARRAHQHVLVFDARVSKPTVMEVLFDLGQGFVPAHTAQVTLARSDVVSTQRVPLGPGLYWSIRFDPFGESGRLRLENVRIEDRFGVTTDVLRPERFAASSFVTIDEHTTNGLSATAVEGHLDPQLVYRFRFPRFLWLSRTEAAYWTGIFYLATLAGALAARLVGAVAARLAGRALWRPAPGRARSPHPWLAVTISAGLATIVAVHPLLLGRSLATPNNGPSTFVYDRPPFVPASPDLAVEDARSSDTDAAMWVTLPYTRVQRDALLDGEFPWWNRRVEGGVPLWGQAQSRLLDPVHWLSLMSNEALGADLSFAAGRFVYATGAGLAALIASGSLAAAVVTAASAPFTGHFTARFNDPGYFAIVYAPWVLWAYGLLAAAERRRERAAACLLLTFATTLAMFAAPPKEGVLVLSAAHLAGIIALLLGEPGRRRGGAGRLAWAMVGAVCAALLTAPHWLIFLETLRDSYTVYEGNAAEFAGMAHAGSLFLGNMSWPLAPGGLHLLFTAGLAAALFGWRHVIASPLAAGCGLAALAGIALAMGLLPEVWVLSTPLLRQVHHVGRSALIAVVPLLTIVAAIGIAALCPSGLEDSPRRCLASGLLAAVVTLLSVLAVADLSDPTSEVELIAVPWIATWPCLFNRAMSRMVGIVATVAFAMVTAALLLPGGLHVETGAAWFDAFLVQPRMRVDLTARPPELAVMAAAGEPFRVAGTERVFSAGVPGNYGLETVTGFEALASPHARRLGAQFSPTHPSALPADRPDGVEAVAPFLDFWGVRYRVALANGGAPSLRVTERPGAWPRAFFVDGVGVHDGTDGFARRLRDVAGPLASVDAADPEAAVATRFLSREHTTIVGATDYRLTPNTTTFTVLASGAGVVVLGEAYWPGVQATLNGRAAPVFRVNETMRGVLISEPGVHVVSFAYRPRYWWPALVMALSGIAVAAVLALLARRGVN